MLTCRDVVQMASDYLDGQLSWRQRLGIRFHLLICDHCRRFMRQLTLVHSVLASGPEPPPAEAEVSALAERLYRHHQQRTGHRHELFFPPL
jgi:anti-sigma factor ChrR (cupin superfamily)